MNKTKLLRLAATAVVVFQLAGIYVFSTASVGAYAEWKDGDTTIWAASSPMAFTWSALGLSLFALLMISKQVESVAGNPAWWRRVVAFLVDFHFGIATLAGIGGGSDLLLEALRTGHFTWSFERHNFVHSDVLFVPLTLVFMASLFLYFAFPLTLGKQTTGCFLLRTKALPPFGTKGGFTWRTALLRTWYEFRGVCSGGWFRPKRDADGNTWYDIESGCRVVLVDYTNSA